MKFLSVCLSFFVFIISSLCAVASISFASSYNMPSKINSEARYLFFMHGTILETKGLNAKHPQYGKYDYSGILKAFEKEGFTVISEVRPANTDKTQYAERILKQIETLFAEGVPAENISVVGFSKGGSITLHVSAIASNPDLNYVVLAGCGKTGKYRKAYSDFLKELAADMQGHMLSLYDINDSITGSCKDAFALSETGLKAREIELNTGKGHGTFYKVYSDWFMPLLEWLSKK